MIGERIKQLRLEKNLSQEQLAEALGYKSRSSIHYIEQGSVDIPTSKIAEFAKFFDVDVEYLMGIVDRRNTSRTFRKIVERYKGAEFSKEISRKLYDMMVAEDHSDYEANSSISYLPKALIQIPVYGTIAAGVPIEAIEDILEYIEIPEEWTKSGKQFIGLKVKGDSMYPKYWEGDTVIIELSPEVNSGDICAVYVNGYEATLKTVKISEDTITLHPYNTQYAPKTYPRSEIAILGKVKQMRRDS